MAERPGKSDAAFRTIGELSDMLGVPQHVLRYWEGRFPQLKPLQRAGNRRYYRPGDVALAARIHQLLSVDGYTVKGVQALLARKDAVEEPLPETILPPAAPPLPIAAAPSVADLRDIRDRLAAALAAA